jgi:hypothetical protein
MGEVGVIIWGLKSKGEVVKRVYPQRRREARG